MAKATPIADPAAARDTALRLLGRREHSALELRHKLGLRGFTAASIDAVITQLGAEDLLNEARYAEVYAHTRADKGYGPLRIQRELRERGVASEDIAVALADLDDFWPRKLADIRRKRFANAHKDASARLQQTRFLRQRGFTLEQINRLFRDS
ncbi:MAG: regulatory protein RecX [Gammaproteobacteria bacterium]